MPGFCRGDRPVAPTDTVRHSTNSSQRSANGQNEIQNPHLPRFPAFGEFLLKRPKGTKSRRWARGLPYAQRELPHGTHRNICPASDKRTMILGAGRNRALCFDLALEWQRVRNLPGSLNASSNWQSVFSQDRLALRLGDINSRMPGFCRGGSRNARLVALQVCPRATRWWRGGFSALFRPLTSPGEC